MDVFNMLLLPDLDQAEVIEAKDFKRKKYAHIEYMTKDDGSLLRVCRPFGELPLFFIPIKSLDSEYVKDMAIINKSHQAEFTGTNENGYYCSHCKINWASLETRNEEDESYDTCPQCHNDMFLSTGNGDAFIMNPFTGQITNNRTGQVLNNEIKVIVTPRKEFDMKAWQDKQQVMQDEQDERIAAYQHEYEMNGQEAAEQFYYGQNYHAPVIALKKISTEINIPLIKINK